MGASQSSENQRNDILIRLDPLLERDFVDDGVSIKNELRCSGCVRTRKRIYNAEKGTYTPF